MATSYNCKVGPEAGSAWVLMLREDLDTLDLNEFDYVCKLDLDLDLPPTYFETLIRRMEDNPRIGTCSGKPYVPSESGSLVNEACGDEMSVGMTKFYRVACFQEIGGFVFA